MAEARGVSAGESYGSLQKANRLAELERGLTEEKAFAFLLGHPLSTRRHPDDGHDLSALHHRALQPGRADLRHLFATPDGPDRVPPAPINDDVSNIIIAQLLFLEADNPDKDIYLYLNSPGGVVSAGMAIYDTMQHLRAPVNTICMGMAASMGSFLLAAGTKGKRSALPHSRIMIHQPSGGAQGTAADIEIQAREILYLRSKMNSLYALHTGQPIETIERDMDRDRFMSADEAKAYGLIDSVFTPRRDLVPKTDGKKET